MSVQFETISDYKNLESGRNIYFASDFHLGASNSDATAREIKVVNWLETVRKDAAAIVLVGDIFDFWFEYEKVIPKGFIRFQGKLLELRDAGIPIIFFTGNHDKWFFDYFPKEFQIPVYYRPVTFEVGDQKVLIGHGDGLGPGDKFYKFLKVIFEAKFSQWLFKWLHPDVGMALAHAWSRSSRISSTDKDHGFQSKEGEWLWQFSSQVEKNNHHDLYIFGHRHVPLELPVTDNSTYFNLGEWVNHFTYLKYDGNKAELLTYSS